MSSDSTDSSKDEYNPYSVFHSFHKWERRTAKKSTAIQPTHQGYVTRRQVAKNAARSIRATSDHFLANFNPETSLREQRKLNKKINPPSSIRRPLGALYDENGVHVTSLTDLCDCLNEECVGCFFDCPKCGSQKCGTECRILRKYVFNQIDYHGFEIAIKNPILKN